MNITLLLINTVLLFQTKMHLLFLFSKEYRLIFVNRQQFNIVANDN
jgi:hypothetical protein